MKNNDKEKHKFIDDIRNKHPHSYVSIDELEVWAANELWEHEKRLRKLERKTVDILLKFSPIDKKGK